MLIIYRNYEEVLVCEKKHEKKLIREWFSEGGRILEEYDREVLDAGILQIGVRVTVQH